MTKPKTSRTTRAAMEHQRAAFHAATERQAALPNSRLDDASGPSVVTMAAKNKCLAQMNKSGTAGKATKKARNPASRVDPMGADHRVVPAIKQAPSMLPPWSQRAVLTSNDYKELAARCVELASEFSEPTVAEALRALASDYLARAAKLHFVFLEPRHEAARHEHCRR
jgi:hypothetical protein